MEADEAVADTIGVAAKPSGLRIPPIQRFPREVARGRSLMWGKMTGPAAGSVLDIRSSLSQASPGLFSRGRDAFVFQPRHTHEHFFSRHFRRASKRPLFQSVAY